MPINAHLARLSWLRFTRVLQLSCTESRDEAHTSSMPTVPARLLVTIISRPSRRRIAVRVSRTVLLSSGTYTPRLHSCCRLQLLRSAVQVLKIGRAHV